MKKYVLFLALVFPLLFTSCDTGDDSPALYVKMATLQDGVDTKYQFFSSGKTYIPLSNFDYGNYKPNREIGQRVWIAYYEVDKQPIQATNSTQEMIDLVSIQNVLTKDVLVLDESNKDDIGDLPIRPIAMNLRDGYLNIEFNFYVPITGEENPVVNLVDNQLPDAPTVGTDNMIPLEIRMTGPTENVRLARGIVSFYLGAYDPTEASGKSGIKLRVKTGDSEVNYELSYDDIINNRLD